jgi:acyl-CoA thioester hydrolase
MIEFRHRVRPRFVDTDAFGMIHHSAYLFYVEEAKFAMMAHPDFFGLRLVGEPERFVVTRLTMKYVRSTHYRPDAELIVDLSLRCVENLLVHFDHVVSDGAGAVCKGTSVHVAIDADGRPLSELPPHFRATYRSLESSHADPGQRHDLPAGLH